MRSGGTLIDIEAISSIPRQLVATSTGARVTARGILAKMIAPAIFVRAFVNVLANVRVLE